MKALLVASVLHRQRVASLRAVVCNGGNQPRARARLARCILDHIGLRDVPVGVGSAGRAYVAKPHEYAIDGYDDVDETRLLDGGALLAELLRNAAPKSLTFVCISSLRDLADLMRDTPELVAERARLVSIMGGIVRVEHARAGWGPDDSVNNLFDFEAAGEAYAFCLSRGVPMAVVNRAAVPLLPMQLARSFAQACVGQPAIGAVMSYLSDAHFNGLLGLWQSLNAGLLPPRCTKEWFFETFCGVPPDEFARNAALCALDGSSDISAHLNGYVKPFDVVALMVAVPSLQPLFAELPDAVHEHDGVRHLLLLKAEQTIAVEAVIALLRETYHTLILNAQDVFAHAQSAVLRGPPVRRSAFDVLGQMSAWSLDRRSAPNSGEAADRFTSASACVSASASANASPIGSPSVAERFATSRTSGGDGGGGGRRGVVPTAPARLPSSSLSSFSLESGQRSRLSTCELLAASPAAPARGAGMIELAAMRREPPAHGASRGRWRAPSGALVRPHVGVPVVMAGDPLGATHLAVRSLAPGSAPGDSGTCRASASALGMHAPAAGDGPPTRTGTISAIDRALKDALNVKEHISRTLVAALLAMLLATFCAMRVEILVGRASGIAARQHIYMTGMAVLIVLALLCVVPTGHFLRTTRALTAVLLVIFALDCAFELYRALSFPRGSVEANVGAVTLVTDMVLGLALATSAYRRWRVGLDLLISLWHTVGALSLIDASLTFALHARGPAAIVRIVVGLVLLVVCWWPLLRTSLQARIAKLAFGSSGSGFQWLAPLVGYGGTSGRGAVSLLEDAEASTSVLCLTEQGMRLLLVEAEERFAEAHAEQGVDASPRAHYQRKVSLRSALLWNARAHVQPSRVLGGSTHSVLSLSRVSMALVDSERQADSEADRQAEHPAELRVLGAPDFAGVDMLSREQSGGDDGDSGAPSLVPVDGGTASRHMTPFALSRFGGPTSAGDLTPGSPVGRGRFSSIAPHLPIRPAPPPRGVVRAISRSVVLPKRGSAVVAAEGRNGCVARGDGRVPEADGVVSTQRAGADGAGAAARAPLRVDRPPSPLREDMPAPPTAGAQPVARAQPQPQLPADQPQPQLPADQPQLPADRSQLPADQPRSRATARRHAARAPLSSAEPWGVDFFVSHAHQDDAHARAAALHRWALRVHDEWPTGVRAPTVWLDVFVEHGEDVSALQQLHARITCLARARRLVVLWGELYVTNLVCIVDICCWLAFGRTLDEVEIVPPANTQQQLHTLITKVDAFHVSQTVRAWREAHDMDGVDVDGRDKCSYRLLSAIELAGVHAVNKAVTSFLPSVSSAVLELREQIESQAAAMGAHGHGCGV